MSLFGNLTNDGLEETQDRVGGFGAVETDYYEGTIKVAYAGKSDAGAQFVNFVVDLGGREYRETVYVTNKKGENFFLNKDDKTKKVPLPGFTVADDICMCAVEKPLAQMDAEDKVVKVYDFGAKKEVNKTVPVLVELLGKKIGLGIVKTLENKSDKQPDGSYVANAETREVNSIEKVFHVPTGFTMVEVRNGVEAPAFKDSWVERNKGKTRDKREIKDGAGGASGAPRASGAAPQQATAGAAAPRKSLFGSK